MDERSRGEEVERLTSHVAEAVSSGRNTVVTPLRPERSERREWFDRLAASAGGRDPAAVVIESLGEVARRLFTSVSPGGLVLTGGETAASVFHELECDGAWVREEIDTGSASPPSRAAPTTVWAWSSSPVPSAMPIPWQRPWTGFSRAPVTPAAAPVPVAPVTRRRPRFQ